MRKNPWWGLFLAAVLVSISWQAGAAEAARERRLGDEDPIPWACVDFGGSWKSDSGKQVTIEQRKCNWLKVKGPTNVQDGSVVIVPDDKVRTFTDDDYHAAVRYRWNSSEYGSVLQTSRLICYANRTVEEYVTLEQVNDNLLLETTYRTTTSLNGDGKPKRSVSQQQLRRKAN
ncbi:MAG: hypothetical protein ACXWQO_14620 [Bdellovibrionota bacterium]